VALVLLHAILSAVAPVLACGHDANALGMAAVHAGFMPVSVSLRL
jgi:hypothetical protein